MDRKIVLCFLYDIYIYIIMDRKIVFIIIKLLLIYLYCFNTYNNASYRL